MVMQYDPQHGILYSSLRIKSTVVSQVLCRPEFYILLGFHGFVSYLYKSGKFSPEFYDMELTMTMTGVTGSLMTFFVVFYNGNVFQRYNLLYELTKSMNEYCLYTVAIITREIPDKNTVRKLSRMLLASSLLFFYERTPHDCPTTQHNISKKEWAHLQALGLLDTYERELLERHCHNLGASAVPSFLLMQWSMKLYRTKSPNNARIAELEKAYWRVRSNQEEVVEILDLPMPFQYFHLMNLMMLMNLTLWAYAFALMDSYLASVIFITIQLVFQGIRELSIALADPYGTDETDFPLNAWVNTLYVRVVSAVEDSWDFKNFPIKSLPPLPQPKQGEVLLDLLADDHPGHDEIDHGPGTHHTHGHHGHTGDGRHDDEHSHDDDSGDDD